MLKAQLVALRWIPAMPFARIRRDALGLPGRGEYMIMHNLYTCWEEQASPDSIQGGCTVRVFNCALPAADDLLLDSMEDGWVFLCCRVDYV